MNVHPTVQTAQLRYLPSAQTVYATPPNQVYQQQQPRYGYASVGATTRYGIKRPRFDDNSANPDDGQYGYSSTALVHRPPIGFQIRHRSTDKTRGLRHFAHKVCEKVKEKGQTNYNEVADELVNEYFDQLVDIPQDPEKYQYDVRNIRRRVYDALNVLMAMNIIEKEKKEIRWVGLPTSSLAECKRLEEEKTQRQERIRQKTEQLQELIVQLVAYKSLVQRNRERERVNGRPANSSILYLPYIIVSTDKKTMVECAIAPDKSEYWFNFDRPFEIHDDIEVLKRLGLAYGIDRGEVAPENVAHIKNCLPPALRDYVDQILEGTLANRKSAVKSISQHGPHSLVKLDPNSPAIHSASTDSIVVRATRANLSGVAPTGDGGPIGSFLGPVSSPAVKTQSPMFFHQQNAPLARYAVIPRPVSARYSSPSMGRFGAQHSTLPLQISSQPRLLPHSRHQPIYGEMNSPNFRQINSPRDSAIYQRPSNAGISLRHQIRPASSYIDEFEEFGTMEEYDGIMQAGEEYMEQEIVEEEVVTEQQI